jgi:hypothetical protein
MAHLPREAFFQTLANMRSIYMYITNTGVLTAERSAVPDTPPFVSPVTYP